jgi:hypothetical protein
VIEGLAFFQLSRFELCVENEIPEEVIDRQTSVRSNGLWYIQIQNKHCSIFLLSGPFFHKQVELAMLGIFPSEVTK